MGLALGEQVADEAFRTHLITTFSQIADHMVNTAGREGCAHSHTEGAPTCSA